MNLLLRVLLITTICVGTGAAADKTWQGGDGVWSSTAHWLLQQAPVAGDRAIIPAGVTATIDLDVTISALVVDGTVVTTPGHTLTVGAVTTTGQLTMGGGTISGATLAAGAGGSYVGTATNTTLAGVTIAANTTLDLSQIDFTVLTVTGGLVVNGTVKVGSTDTSSSALVFCEVSQTWSGTGDVLIGANGNNRISLDGAGTTLTIANPLVIHGREVRFLSASGASGIGLTNNGTIAADVAGGTFNITPQIATLTNGGVLAVAAGAILTVNAPTLTSTGAINANAGTLFLAGTFSTATALTVHQSNASLVQLAGTLVNTGNSFSPAATGGDWVLNGGTVDGGTISGTASLVGSGAGGTLNALTIAAGNTLDLSRSSNSAIAVTAGLTINGTVKIGSPDNSTFGEIFSNVSQTWSGSGDVLFGASGNNRIHLDGGGVTLTLASPLTVHGSAARFLTAATGTTLLNQGTIVSDAAGAAWSFSTSAFVNAGTISLSQGLPQTWTLATAFSQTSTGTMDIEIGSSSTFDTLQVTGSASLDGTLNLTTIGGFVPTTGQTFGFLTTPSARSGAFATVNGAFSLNPQSPTVLLAVAASVPAVVVSSSPVLTNAASIPFTLTFSEAVTGLTAGGLTLVNGTAGTITGGPTVFTVPITPGGQGTVSLTVNANAAHNAAPVGNTASNTASVTFDSAPPTVVITPNGTTTPSQPIPFTLTFSEPVTGLAAGDLTVTNGVAGAITGNGSSVLVVQVAPATGGTVSIQLKANSVTDLAGNANATASAVAAVTFAPPTNPTVVVSPASGTTNSSVITFVLTFSQPVTGVTAAGLTVTNGTIGTIDGSGDTFTVDVSPIDQGTVTLLVKAGATTGTAGALPNVASTLASLDYDSVQPTVVVSPDGTTATTSPITFTMTFSENVTGFSLGDISTTSGSVQTLTGGPKVFSFTVAVTEPGPVAVHLGSDAAHDSAGNLNIGSNTATVDFEPAAQQGASVVVTPFQPLQKAGPVSFSVVFSAAVTGFGADDLTVVNGTAPVVSGSGASYTVTVDVTASADGPVTLAVVAGAAVDASDVPTQASTVASTILDTTPPRVHLALSGAIPVTTGITLVMTFSEPVTGFGEPLVVVTNATTSAFTAIDAATYSVVLTPTGNGASMVAAINVESLSDLAGNRNLGATLTIPVESSLVSASVTTPPVPLSSGDQVVYTALGPGTNAGLEQVRSFLAGKTNSQARGFIWDAGAQAYVQVPTAGWQPFEGVFLATREATAFDFNGNTTTLDFTLTLRPGYNFICVPPLNDDGDVLVDHAFADLALERTDGAVISDHQNRVDLIGTGAFLWDGTAYSQVDTLHTGTGYWIENASSPPVDLVLRRASGSLAQLGPIGGAVHIGARTRSSPPPPPGGTASGSTAGNGGGKACGVGSGLASLVLALSALFLRLRLRGPRRA